MSDKVRIDVWLWRARFFKTRSLAARAVEGGAVRLMRGTMGRLVAKPAESVGPGDVLTVVVGRALRTIRVLASGERRGPAAEARTLYAEEGVDLDGADRSGHVGGADAPDRSPDRD